MQYNRAAGSEEAVYVEWIKNGLNQPAGVDVRGKKCTLTLKTNFNLLNFPFMWLLCDRGVTAALTSAVETAGSVRYPASVMFRGETGQSGTPKTEPQTDEMMQVQTNQQIWIRLLQSNKNKQTCKSSLIQN